MRAGRTSSQATIAFEKRSANMTAIWALAAAHSRGGIFHSFSERFKTRNSNFSAASSLGKWPLARTARRSLEFSASMALVTGMRERRRRPAASDEQRMVRPSGTRRREHEGAGRPIYTMSRELELVAGRLCDSPGCAESANRGGVVWPAAPVIDRERRRT